MDVAREDLLAVRTIIADKYLVEMIPNEIIDVLNEVTDVDVVDEPGLVSVVRDLKRSERWKNGDNEYA